MGSLASLRLIFQGSKEVLLFPYIEFAKFVNRKIGSVPKEKDVLKYLATITADALKEYKDGGGQESTLCHATAGPHQVLYVPAGWMYLERVGQQCDQLGIRLLVLGPDNAKMLDEVRVHAVQASEAEGPSFILLQKAIDILSLNS